MLENTAAERPYFQRGWVVAATAAVVLVLAGCADNGDEPERIAVADETTTTTVEAPTTTPTTTTTPPPPPPPTTTTTVVQPPPPPPVTEQPPPPAVEPAPQRQCDPNYSGCVPIASDVDCAGGSGNGPAYADGPVQVIGTDIYDLDRDGDGTACE